MSDIVKHYMWQDGGAYGKPYDGSGKKDVDIEQRWPGLKYSKCDGLNVKGKRKNVHTEKYADSPELRVWLDPNVILREATDITLTLYFTGDDRQAMFDNFVKFCSNGKIHYWDTMRKKHAYMILVDQARPKEDIYKGSIPYILVDLKFQNLWGECPTREISEL
jgi:hypothetical protein